MTEQAQHGAVTQAGADLTRLWEEHIRHEFVTGSTEDTLDTMVEDTYVNHIPVLTGGCGQAELREFYSAHFIPRMPPDMEMVPVSRTIGSDQLVDEMVIKFTHSRVFIVRLIYQGFGYHTLASRRPTQTRQAEGASIRFSRTPHLGR